MIQNYFVGPIEEFSGLINASTGSVVVLLKNGKPNRVISPGKQVIRGFGAPLFGKLEAVQVNTSEITLPLTLKNVLTKSEEPKWLEGYSIPEIHLDIRIQINPDNNFGNLKNLVQRRGLGFAESLVVESTNILEAHVRSVVANWTTSELRRKTVASILDANGKPLPFGSGVLHIASLSADIPIWPTEYIRRVATEQNRMATIAEEHTVQAVESAKKEFVRRSESEQVTHEGKTNKARQEYEFEAAIANVYHEIQANSLKQGAERRNQLEQSVYDINDMRKRVRGYAPVALALGVPLHALIDLGGQSGIVEGARDLLDKLADPANARLMRESPNFIATVLRAAGFEAGGVSQVWNEDIQSAVVDTLISDSNNFETTSVSANSIDGESADSVFTAAIIIDDDLSIDARIQRIWKSVYPDETVKSLAAIGSAQYEQQSTVIAVLGQPMPQHPPLEKDFRTRVAHLLKVEDVSIMRLLSSDYNGLAQQFIAQTARPSTSKFQVSTEVLGDGLGISTLHVYLGGELSQARDTVDFLNAEGGTELKALESILPFSNIVLHAGVPDGSSNGS